MRHPGEFVVSILPPRRSYPDSRPERVFLTQRLREFLQFDANAADVETNAPQTDAEDTRGLAHHLLQDAVRERATDIHFQPGSGSMRIRFRIDGILHDSLDLPHAQGDRLLRCFKTLAAIDPMPLVKPHDGRAVYDLDGRMLHLRIACTPSVCGDTLAVRILDPALRQHGLTDLGLSAADRRAIDHWLSDVVGMFLVVGPTGCGKTTTLYALLERLRLSSRNVIALEDPVEYQIDGVTQVNLDERHGLDFAEGLKTMLRLDPDYILLGELRDAASAAMAVQASGSGKTLMSTLHSRDAVGAITTLRNYGLADHEIVAALELVVSQRLIRKLCPHCRRKGPPDEVEKSWLAMLDCAAPEESWHPVGCDQCQQTGYCGRTGVFEVWRLDGAADGWISNHLDEHSMRRLRREQGARSLLDDALDKAAEGITSLSEVHTLGGLGHLLAPKNKQPKMAP